MGGVLARFYRPGGGGFELLSCPGGGEFAHQKNCPGVLPEGGWSGLELTDTLEKYGCSLLDMCWTKS